MAVKQSNVYKFFAEKVDWNQSDRDILKARANGWRFFGISGWAAAIILAIVIIPLTVFHQFIPIVVTVDHQSGNYTVHPGFESINMEDKANETRMIADIGRYLKAREGFTRGEAESNYQTVYYMDDTSMRPAWDQEYKPEVNPNALLNTLSAKDANEIQHMSITFLPSDNPRYKIAQVFFDKVRRRGSRLPTTQKYVSTFTYYYDKANIPGNIDGIIFNPFGFTVLNYRSDKQTEEIQMVPSQDQPQSEVFKTTQPAQIRAQ